MLLECRPEGELMLNCVGASGVGDEVGIFSEDSPNLLALRRGSDYMRIHLVRVVRSN